MAFQIPSHSEASAQTGPAAPRPSEGAVPLAAASAPQRTTPTSPEQRGAHPCSVSNVADLAFYLSRFIHFVIFLVSFIFSSFFHVITTF